MAAITLSTCQGRDIAPHLEALARLRIRGFRDYLCDGDPAHGAGETAKPLLSWLEALTS